MPKRRTYTPSLEGISMVKVEHESAWGYDDVRAYDVRLNGQLIGRVSSHREESWRKAGRIRTGKIGDPKHWQAHAFGWKVPDARNAFDNRVGYRFYSREDAVHELVATYRRALKEQR